MMKLYLILTALLCVVTLIFPFFTNSLAKRKDIIDLTTQTVQASTEKNEQNEEEEKTEEAVVDEQESIRVLKMLTGKVTKVSLFDYIVGTVAGEMPASFSQEALKAQAVASYTYAKWIRENQKEKSDSDITDSSSSHQCYLDTDEQKEKWGDDYEECISKIKKAVKSVYGQYLTFEGKTAMTVFHAMSFDKTQAAEEIWGENIPYLIPVEAYGDNDAVAAETEVSFLDKEFKKLFEEGAKITLSENQAKKWAQVHEKDEKGYIKKLKIGEELFSADEVKEILSLPGTCFKARLEKDTFIFTVYGKGHGVGMSQYGADYMARQGKSYKEILSHFYPGTMLVKE